jgi:hypothetical protein
MTFYGYFIRDRQQSVYAFIHLCSPLAYIPCN